MKTMLRISMPVEPANDAVLDGSLSQLFQGIADQWRPDSVYFYAEKGRRVATFVVDLKDAAQIPPLAEPFFQRLHADVEIFPVMTMEDMRRGVVLAARQLAHVQVAA